MREYVVTCCSTADMSRTFMETNEVPFAMFHYQLDGKEYADDLYSSISPEVFYKMIGDGAQPVTSQVNAEAYCALFEPVLKSGKDVLHLTLSSGISGSINSANVAKTQMEEKYPDRRVMVWIPLRLLLVTVCWWNRHWKISVPECLWRKMQHGSWHTAIPCITGFSQQI